VARSGRAGAVALLVALSSLACNLSTEPDRSGKVEVLEFRVEAAVPAGTVVDGRLSVPAGARLSFAFAADGAVEKLVLSAGERVLAELPPDATSYVDDCAAGPCGTAAAGEVLYTLAAVGSDEDASTDARSLSVLVTESAAP
jgi:hypothetical protein